MCRCSSSLVYGLTLQALELCIAADAHKNVEPALLAVDLIRSRQANGTLATSTPERRVTVCALPVEMWDLVKQHITRQAYLHRWFGIENQYGDWSDCEDDGPADGTLEFLSAMRGDMAFDIFMEDGGVVMMAHDCRKRVVTMLESFGLCLATVDLISDEESSYFDFKASWCVGLPLRGDKGKMYPHVKAEIPHEADPVHSLYRISPSTFVLPADADSRFRRLLSSFPALVPTSHTTGTIRPPGPSSTSLEASQDKAAGEERTARKKLSKEERRERDLEKKGAARVPGWMLVASGSSCM